MNLPVTIQGLQNLAAGDALTKAGRALPRIAIVGLITLIAWQAAKLTWLVMPRPVDTTPAATAIPPPASFGRNAARGTNAQKVVDAHLFGVANAPDAANVEDLQPTQMTLVLAGVIPTEEPTRGFAFIGESVPAAKFVKTGDPIAGGVARLHSVYPDRVILDRGGRLETLLYPRQDNSMMRAQPAPQIAAAPPPGRFVENARRLAETNPAAFNEIVRSQIAIDKGAVQGFRVYPGRNRQQFAKLGLQPGDLVKAINGTPLDDPQRSAEIFNTLAASDQAQITIERNGQIQQLSLNTAQIALPEGTDPQPQPGQRETGTPPQEIRPNDPALLDPRGAEIQ